MLKLKKRVNGWIDKNLGRFMSFYPPYFGAAVRVTESSEDFRHIRVEMPLRFYNRNYAGTHFGGSLYSMVDPFYMLMLMKNLGPNYIVWDRGARIDFKSPGRGTVTADFELTAARIDEIRRLADEAPKVEPVFLIHILDHSGQVVAEVEKTLYVRRKSTASNI